MVDKIKIVSLNVCGLQNDKKRRNVFAYLKLMSADIYMLQETHCTPEVARCWQTEWGSTILNAYGTSSSCGCSIMFNRQRKVQVYSVIEDENGQFVMADVSINDYRFSIVNVYGPNEDSPNYYEQVFKHIDTMGNCELMIMSDFNLTLNHKIDRLPHKEYSKGATQILKKIIEDRELCDVWRVNNPQTIQYSWSRFKPQFTGSRIDFMLANGGLINRVLEIGYEASVLSDHQCLVCEMNFVDQPWGPGYWKFNNCLLSDPIFVEKVNALIEDIIVKFNKNDAVTKWEMFKAQLTKRSQNYGKEKCKNKKRQFNEAKIALELAQQAAKLNPNQHNIETLHVMELKMQELLMEKSRAVQFRSKARWAREGERKHKE